MKRNIPLILILMLLFIGCMRTPDTTSISSSTERTMETAEPSLDLQNAGVDSTTEPQSIEPTPELPVDEQPWAQNSSPAAPTVEPTSKPQQTPHSMAPTATLKVVVPTLEPESTPKPTAKPTVKPTEKPTPPPKPPQSTEAPLVPPEEPPVQLKRRNRPL